MPATTLPLPRSRASLPASMRAALARSPMLATVCPPGARAINAAASHAAERGATRDDLRAHAAGLLSPRVSRR